MPLYPDGSKPNHYAHDSLGDPATCRGDHNHPARKPSKALVTAIEVMSRAILIGVAILFGVGVYAVARLAF